MLHRARIAQRRAFDRELGRERRPQHDQLGGRQRLVSGDAMSDRPGILDQHGLGIRLVGGEVRDDLAGEIIDQVGGDGEHSVYDLAHAGASRECAFAGEEESRNQTRLVGVEGSVVCQQIHSDTLSSTPNLLAC